MSEQGGNRRIDHPSSFVVMRDYSALALGVGYA
jgi:hypothetical protein